MASYSGPLSNGSSASSIPIPSPAEIAPLLESLLDAKSRQLEQAGILGQRVLAQQMELEERVKALQAMTAGLDLSSFEEDVYGGIATNTGGQRRGTTSSNLGNDALNSFRELAETITQWDQENKMLNEELATSLGVTESSRVRTCVYS